MTCTPQTIVIDPLAFPLSVLVVGGTNTHSPVLETWRRISTLAGGRIVSAKVSNAWTGNAWLLFFNAAALPADGALSVRAPIQVPIGQVNGDTWQGYTTGFANGMLCALSTTQPQLTAITIAPVITGDAAQLSLPAFRGCNNSNTDIVTGPALGTGSAYLYGEITIPAGNATLTVFQDAAHAVPVASGALVGNAGGVITLAAIGGSLITGPITIAAAAVQALAVVFEITTGGFFDGEVL